jgi:hypothetical protein
MPMLAWRHDETTYIVIPSTVCFSFCFSIFNCLQYAQGIDFLYNVQHDCPLAKCTASGKQALMQERVESGLFKTHIEHQPVERFVINTHAFHNAHLLRATLPRSIASPVRLHEDRYSLHTGFAEAIRVAKAGRTAAKAQAERMGDAMTPAATIAESRPNKRMRSTMEGAEATS